MTAQAMVEHYSHKVESQRSSRLSREHRKARAENGRRSPPHLSARDE